MSTFKLPSELFSIPKILNNFGSLFGTGFVIVAPSKNNLDKNNDTPGPIKLIAIPETVWSALKVTDATACNKAKSPPAIPPQRSPNQGLTV